MIGSSYVSTDVRLPESTLKAYVPGVLFGIIFGAANAYLGLRAGLTISTSIPIAVMTVAAFAEPRVALLTSGRLRDFHEWETTATTRVFSPFAVRTSHYAKSGILDAAPYAGRGTKLFQFAMIDGQWRIASLCWYDDEASSGG